MQSYQRPIKVYSVSGCCFIIRSKIFEEINYFDSNVFLFGEEYILGEKLYKKIMMCILCLIYMYFIIILLQ